MCAVVEPFASRPWWLRVVPSAQVIRVLATAADVLELTRLTERRAAFYDPRRVHVHTFCCVESAHWGWPRRTRIT
eukprot:1638876-Prymnesium_polylepis.1